MIHLGSIVGAGVSQFQSKTLGFQLPFFTRFRQVLPSWLSITVQITPPTAKLGRTPYWASPLAASSLRPHWFELPSWLPVYTFLESYSYSWIAFMVLITIEP
jgi:hypothetical protein